MRTEVFNDLIKRIEAYFGNKLVGTNRRQFRVITYDVDDKDAINLYDETIRRCRALPSVTTWRGICKGYRRQFKAEENEEYCFSCGDEGVIFWTQDGNSFSGLCPMCRKGASMKAIDAKAGFCPNDIAIAFAHYEKAIAAKDAKGKHKEMALYLIGIGSIKKERGIEVTK